MAHVVDMLVALPLHGTTDKKMRVDISQSGQVISLGTGSSVAGDSMAAHDWRGKKWDGKMRDIVIFSQGDCAEKAVALDWAGGGVRGVDSDQAKCWCHVPVQLSISSVQRIRYNFPPCLVMFVVTRTNVDGVHWSRWGWIDCFRCLPSGTLYLRTGPYFDQVQASSEC